MWLWQILSVFSDADKLPNAMRPYVAYAVQKGAVTGFEDKSNGNGLRVLKPNEIISRAEASVFLSNLIGYASVSYVNAFADADRIPD